MKYIYKTKSKVTNSNLKKYILNSLVVLSIMHLCIGCKDSEVINNVVPVADILSTYDAARNKELSPPVAFAAKETLRSMRFFANAKESKIFQLLERLFPSPDGFYFVPNQRNSDLLGVVLGKSPKVINHILRIIYSNKSDEYKKTGLRIVLDIFNKDIPKNQKVKNANLEKELNEATELIVQAFNEQEKLGKDDLFPKDIVPIMFLAYANEIFNSIEDLAKIDFLWKDREKQIFKKRPLITAVDYAQIVDLIENDSNAIITNNLEENILKAIDLWKGYYMYTCNLARPISYQKTIYEKIRFPDCGETSIENILGLILSRNRTKITDNLNELITKIEWGNLMEKQNCHNLLKDTSILRDNELLDIDKKDSPLMKLVKFFKRYDCFDYFGTAETHENWAKVVSDLNLNSTKNNIDKIYYINKGICEIGSDAGKPINTPNDYSLGIMNVLNVISHIIPDKKLDEPWQGKSTLDAYSAQINQKIERLCELLSNETYSIDFEGDTTKLWTSIVFTLNNLDKLEWSIMKGHFQLEIKDGPENILKIMSDHEFGNFWINCLFPQKSNNDPKYIFNYDLSDVKDVLHAVDKLLNSTKYEQYYNTVIHLLNKLPDDTIGIDKIISWWLSHEKYALISELFDNQKKDPNYSYSTVFKVVDKKAGCCRSLNFDGFKLSAKTVENLIEEHKNDIKKLEVNSNNKHYSIILSNLEKLPNITNISFKINSACEDKFLEESVLLSNKLNEGDKKVGITFEINTTLYVGKLSFLKQIKTPLNLHVYKTLSYDDLKDLASIPNLLNLRLYGYALDDIKTGMNHKVSFDKLKTLKIGSGKPVDFDNTLNNLLFPNLIDLTIEDNVKYKSLNFLNNFTNLERLEFSCNRELIQEDREIFAGLKNLKTLKLSFNPQLVNEQIFQQNMLLVSECLGLIQNLCVKLINEGSEPNYELNFFKPGLPNDSILGNFSCLRHLSINSKKDANNINIKPGKSLPLNSLIIGNTIKYVSLDFLNGIMPNRLIMPYTNEAKEQYNNVFNNLKMIPSLNFYINTPLIMKEFKDHMLRIHDDVSSKLEELQITLGVESYTENDFEIIKELGKMEKLIDFDIYCDGNPTQSLLELEKILKTTNPKCDVHLF